MFPARRLRAVQRHIVVDGPTSTRKAAQKAQGGRRRLATGWVVIPLIIVLVFMLVFGLKLFLGNASFL